MIGEPNWPMIILIFGGIAAALLYGLLHVSRQNEGKDPEDPL